MSRIKILKRTSLVTTAILATTLLVVTHGALRAGPTANSQLPAVEIETGSSSQGAKARMGVELVTLRAEGFEPLTISRPKGPFVLLVDNRSGKDDSSLRLQRVNREHLRDVNTSRKMSEWHGLIDLPPGDYILLDTANPDKRCQITIFP